MLNIFLFLLLFRAFPILETHLGNQKMRPVLEAGLWDPKDFWNFSESRLRAQHQFETFLGYLGGHIPIY